MVEGNVAAMSSEELPVMERRRRCFSPVLASIVRGCGMRRRCSRWKWVRLRATGYEKLLNRASSLINFVTLIRGEGRY